MRARRESIDGMTNTVALYHDYLTVIYGLLATEGLVVFSGLALGHALTVSGFLLFLGTFLTSLHFWFVCVTVDQISQPCYSALAGSNARLRTAFLLVDALFAAAFAGSVLIMFHSLSADTPQHQVVFLSMVWLAGLSLLYDLYSFVVVAGSQFFDFPADSKQSIVAYGKVVRRWMVQDAAYCILAVTMYVATRTWMAYEGVLASMLALVALGVLVLDVVVLDPIDDSQTHQDPSSPQSG